MDSADRPVAVVVGSTRNIGRTIAERLSADGYHVVVTSRHGDDAERVAAELRAEATGFEVDVTEPAEVEGLFEHVDATFGRLDALVNNVAYTANESILDCDLETWERTIQTNLRSYFLTTKHAAALMNDGGAIVNVTVSSTRGLPEKFSYMTSKGAVTYLTRAAALDLIDEGIRVNAVGSGLVGTPVGYNEMAGRPDEIDRIPAGHPGDPEDVAAAVSFLVSDDADYVVGAKLDVDGGLEASL